MIQLQYALRLPSCLKVMMNRIQRIRADLRDSLEKLGSPFNWEHITNQVGCSTVKPKSYFGP